MELASTGAGRLRDTLSNQHLMILGDPGAGKTTFLRWISHTLCGDRLGETEDAVKKYLGFKTDDMPVLVSIADWLEHIACTREKHDGSFPSKKDDPQWLTHYLGTQCDSLEQGLDAVWFRKQLRIGNILILLDGLDEATDREARELAVALIEKVARAFADCRIVVTSRPAGHQGTTTLNGFELTRIAPLNDAAVATFIDRWSRALHPGNHRAAKRHRNDLQANLNALPSIRRMARNTVMLTALAVVHYNEKRLPEQRAELYESILTWLARSREERPGRPRAEQCLEILRELALAITPLPGVTIPL